MVTNNNETLKSKSIHNNVIMGIPIIQNKQEFIISNYSIQEVLTFTKYTQRLIVNFDEENIPIYNDEIQRFVEQPRVEKIADFLIHDPEATFPTNIVLHVPQQVIEKQIKKERFVLLYLDKSKVFDEVKKEKGDVYITIIDGQHRIKGIETAIARLKKDIEILEQTIRATSSSELEEKHKKFTERLYDLMNIELVVSFFIDKTLEYQAMIFSTINRTQRRVSQNLVYSLFGLTAKDTPQKTALQVVLALNGHKNSPFFKRIKLYGGSYEKNESPPLSQATMVRSIVDLICENFRESEKDRFKKRKELFKRATGSIKFLPFREYYAKNEDSKISDILFYYFNAIRSCFKNSQNISYWNFDIDYSSQSNILQTTVGYEALLKICMDILKDKNFNKSNISKEEEYKQYLIKASNLNFSDQKRYPFSTKGKNILYQEMNINIWPPKLSDKKDKRLERLNELLKE